EPQTFNRFLAQENIRLGQRVEAFSIEAQIDGKWQKIGEGTTIGYKRILLICLSFIRHFFYASFCRIGRFRFGCLKR
ncbi:hypothetical protein RAO00_09280, partial [Ornithobacterium rhinotracheale]|uniref:hypothetical protein n=1 Tax=Ornithobacterium rhinotracheale TaxID=28251 RepID=UPI003873C821